MKRLYLAMTVGVGALLALAYWKNTFSYSYKPIKWRIGKSVIDCTLVVLSALYLPALLVGWCVMWLTRPLNRRGVQVTLAVILGIMFSAMGGIVLEVLCVLGIFAVDLVTGQQGLYGWWQQSPPSTFMPYMNEREMGA